MKIEQEIIFISLFIFMCGFLYLALGPAALYWFLLLVFFGQLIVNFSILENMWKGVLANV